MKHIIYIAFTSLLLIGCLHIADTSFAAAQETVPQEGDEAESKERTPVQLAKVTVILDGEDVVKQEGIHEWAGKAAQLVAEWYPIFDKLFESEGFVPENEVTLVFRKMDGVAHASGGTITISADWVRQRPDDFGMVAHELVHVIQRYPGGRGEGRIPGWAMEGIADFARHAYYEPDVLMRPTNPDRNTYTDSYQITGGFFMWIEHVYDKEFIKKLNTHARQRTYSNELFETYTSKDIDTLWQEFADFLRTIPGNRILPVRDFGREKLGTTYSVERRRGN